MNALQSLFSGRYPELIMFDLDGTLLDSVPDLAASVDNMLSTLGLPKAGVDKVKIWVGNGLPALVRRALTDGDDQQALDPAYFAKAQNIFTDFYRQQDSLTRVYPQVHETLDFLQQQNIKLALITNKPEQFLPAILQQHGLDRCFSWVVGGDSLAKCKPDPEQLLWVMQQAQVRPDNALFIGDSCNDIRAAKAAKVKNVGLTYGYNHGQPIAHEQPNLVLDNLQQLLAL